MYVSVATLLVAWGTSRWPAARVATETPQDLQEQLSAIVIRRFGGVDVELSIDRPWVDVDIYGGSPAAVETLSMEVFSAFRFELPGLLIGTSPSRGVVAKVATLSGPSGRPVTDPNLRRIGMSFEVRIQAR